MQPAEASFRGQVPRAIRHELARPDLLRRLTEHEGNLVALVAPGGYGKTTLLAQHARRYEGRAVWLSLSQDDADPLVLANHLAGTVRRVLPSLHLTAWDESRKRGGSAEGLAHALAQDLNGGTTNFEFILDGCDVLQGTAGSWLARWLNDLAEGHRLLLSGRAAPPLGLAQRVAHGDARLIGIHELAFSAAETAACLGDGAPTLEAAQIHAHLEGWPVGVALVGSGAAPQLTPADLIRDVLDGLPTALRQALPEVSVLDVWNEAEASQLGLTLPPGWVGLVRQAGLPLIPLGGSDRPHQLLREVLDAELQTQRPRHQALHLLVGERAEASGERLQALQHYLTAGADDRAMTLARVLTEDYENRWEYQLVRQVLEQFPEHALPPELLRLLGHALLETGEGARGEGLLYRLRQAGQNSPGLLRSLAVVASRAGQIDRLLALTEEGLALSTTPGDQRRFLLIKAHALRQADRPAEALVVAQQVAALAESAGNLVDYGSALGQLEQTYGELGRWVESEAAVRQALEVYTRLGMPGRIPQFQINLAGLLLKQDQPAEAHALLDLALPESEQEEGTDLAQLLELRGDVYLWQSRHAEALEAYERATSVSERLNISILSLRIAPKLSEAAFSLGRLDQAEDALAQLQRAAQADVPYAAANLWVCRGLRARHDRDWPGAERAFAAAKARLTDLGTAIGYRAVLYGAEASCALEHFTLPDAVCLDADLQRAERFHLLPEDRPLLERLIAACVQLQGLTSALQRLAGPGPEMPIPTPTPETLTLAIQTLGTLRVQLGGQPVHMPLRKSAEVLVWLALNGPGSRDQIIDALWDGSNERRHIEYFKVAVRHLRLALVTHPAVTFNPLPFDEGRYRLAERFTVETDTAAARIALKLSTEASLRRALAVYAGPFLHTTETDWAATLRLDVLETTVAAALKLGTLLEQTAPDEAVAVYERTAELEPLGEDSYVRLIRLHTARGDEASAKRVYLRYRRMLAEEWGRRPEEELMLAYERP